MKSKLYSENTHCLTCECRLTPKTGKVIDHDYWAFCVPCFDKNSDRDLMELVAHFGVALGFAWDDLYQRIPDSVELSLLAIEMAQDFYALWTSGVLEDVEDSDYDGSWLSYIDDFADFYFKSL